MLTKKFRLLYKDNQIINENYLNEQTGFTYPGCDVQTFEADSPEEIQQYVIANNLILLPSDITV